MIIGITGHQSIPRDALAFIEREIDAALAPARETLIGISSLAAGADQIFARQILRNDGQLHVIVPSTDYASAFADSSSHREYKRLLSHATRIETMPFDSPTEKAYLAAGRLIVDRSTEMLAVWDGLPAKGEGGTADIVAYARQAGKSIRIVWPDNTVR
jgi:hypothetical protein